MTSPVLADSLPAKMRAALVTSAGEPEVLHVRDVQLPALRSSEVLVRVQAAALNFRDTKQRREPPPGIVHPYIPGSDFAGQVCAVGSEVTRLQVGQSVVGAVHDGACAQYVAVDEAFTLPIPAGLDAALAATLPVSGLSASFLVSSSRIAAGATAVVHAAAGGLGCYLAGLLRARGVITIGLTSNDAKVAVARDIGFTHVVNYRTHDPLTAVLEITEGRGVDVVFDSVGGPGFAQSFAMLANEGTVMFCGRSAGEPDLATITEELLASRRNRALREFYLNTHLAEHPDQIAPRIDELAHMLTHGAIKVPVTRHPLDDIATAHQALQAGSTIGKVVVEPSPDAPR
ncbi:MAG: NADPH:quinone reductase [Actinomycetota bacterium]|nr:NADPH:quinone reductase [Actinomycetota bacterium]